MATQLKSSTKPGVPNRRGQSEQIKQYVNHQLEKTRRQVKTTDLIGGILTILAFAILFLMAVAIWDAWIMPLSTLGRWICLSVLLGGSMLYAGLAIVPLFVRRINTEYAAKMIEDAKPTFKNSLLNYVSLRKKNQTVRPAVFEAVSRQAATDLATVPSDATVDRSKLIRLGFVLIGLVVFAIAYQVLSPKNPLQTFARVLAPGAKIAQPAVVRITDVEPGDHKIFFGDDLDILAVVRGRHQPNDVKVEYETRDGQLIDQVIQMNADESKQTYRAKIRSVQQSIRYRIVARDGATPFFDVAVQPNPTIAVESLVLRPPSYTKLPERKLVGTGNVDALEGTDVTINAVANLPIKLAYIELLEEISSPDSDNRMGGTARYKELRELEMKSDGKSASARVKAQLNASRKKPFATHYQIRFISTDGDKNEKPNIYPIRITPDLAPEVLITSPAENDVTVPENGMLPILIEANDLDFEISAVNFRLDYRGGTKRLDEKLQLNSTTGNQRVSARYLLKPSELGLKVGDKALFFATASDNRTSPQSGLPDPNVSRTDNYTLTISQPQEQARDSENQEGDSQQQKQPKQPNNDQPDGEEQQEGSAQGDQNSGSDGESESGSQSGESPQASKGNDETSKSPDGDIEKNDEAKGSQQGDQKGNQGESPDSSDQPQPQPGDSGQSGQGESTKGQGNEAADSQAGNGESQSGNNDPSNSDSGAEPSPNGQSGEKGDANNQTGSSASESNSEMSPENSGQDAQQDGQLTNGNQEKLSENASEGDQFRKLQEMLEDLEQQDRQDGNSDNSEKQTSANQDRPADNNADNNTGNESDQRNDRQSDSNSDSSSRSQTDSTNRSQGDQESQAGEGRSEMNRNSDAANQDPANANENRGNGESQETSSGNPNLSENSGDSSQDNGKRNGEAQESQSNEAGPEPSQDSKSGDPSTQNQSDRNTPNEPSDADPQTDRSSPETSPSDRSNDGQPGSSSASQEPDSSPSSQTSPEESDSGQSGNPSQGQSGAQQNASSGQSDSEQKEPSDGESGSEESQNRSDRSADEAQSGRQNQSESQGGAQGSGTSSGDQSESQNAPPPSSTSSPSGAGGGGESLPTETLQQEQENLEHSKKATDLVLSKLEQQQYEPDPKLLEEMNWTEEDLNNFLRRWKEMKRQAELGNPKAKAKYERALKSLGLRPDAKRRAVTQIDEEIKGLNEDSAVIKPPPHLAPDFNATLRDLNRARND